MGRAAFVLGAGRRHAAETVDFGVGLKVWVRPGEVVAKGQPLVTIVHRDRALEEARALIGDAVPIGDGAVTVAPLVHEVLA